MGLWLTRRVFLNCLAAPADIEGVHEQDSSTWWSRRLAELSERIADNDYWVPAEDIAHAILFGRPKWGDNPITVGRVQEEDLAPNARRRA